MKKVSIIVAHPDDEVLGCGGSIARLAREGAAIHIMILATGVTSRGLADGKAISALQDEARGKQRLLLGQ